MSADPLGLGDPFGLANPVGLGEPVVYQRKTPSTNIRIMRRAGWRPTFQERALGARSSSRYRWEEFAGRPDPRPEFDPPAWFKPSTLERVRRLRVKIRLARRRNG